MLRRQFIQQLVGISTFLFGSTSLGKSKPTHHLVLDYTCDDAQTLKKYFSKSQEHPIVEIKKEFFFRGDMVGSPKVIKSPNRIRTIHSFASREALDSYIEKTSVFKLNNLRAEHGVSCSMQIVKADSSGKMPFA